MDVDDHHEETAEAMEQGNNEPTNQTGETVFFSAGEGRSHFATQ